MPAAEWIKAQTRTGVKVRIRSTEIESYYQDSTSTVMFKMKTGSELILKGTVEAFDDFFLGGA